MKKTIITNSFEETQKAGEEYTKQITKGDVICLFGDLGFGKTTFVQGLAKGLGIEGRIISPTFLIMRSYKITGNNILYMLFHIDLYRVNNDQEIIDLGIMDIIANKQNIIVIEWAERMESLLPRKRTDIYFEYIDENKRKINFIKYV